MSGDLDIFVYHTNICLESLLFHSDGNLRALRLFIRGFVSSDHCRQGVGILIST